MTPAVTAGARQQRANDDIARQPVGPLWKNVRHFSLLFCVLNRSEHKTPAIVLATTNLVNLFSRAARNAPFLAAFSGRDAVPRVH